jgi:type IV secretion system protein TrbL
MSAAGSPLRKAAGAMKESYQSGSRAAFTATGGKFSNAADIPASAPGSSNGGPPAWAQRLRRQ